MARKEKVQEAILKEVSSILQDKMHDPRLGFVTITAVEVTADLRYAKVYYSVLGKDEDAAKTKEALDSALGYIRTLVAERIQLRFAPEIVFKRDTSSQYGSRIEEVLNEIKEMDEKNKRNPEGA
jgi:ribosome-binding factor A